MRNAQRIDQLRHKQAGVAFMVCLTTYVVLPTYAQPYALNGTKLSTNQINFFKFKCRGKIFVEASEYEMH